MSGTVCHFEFMSTDPGKCTAFYKDVFGWTFDSESMPGYHLVRTGKDPGGGIMEKPAEAPMPCLNLYFQVESIEATLGKVTAGGGQVVVPRTEIPPGAGYFAMFADPEGIVVGVYETPAEA